VHSGVLGLASPALVTNPGGSFIERGEGEGDDGTDADSGVGLGDGVGLAAGFVNFRCTYLSRIHFSRDSLSESGVGFFILRGITASN
jgi:hypothetical protein